MADYILPDKPYEMTADDEDCVRETMREFTEMTIWRNVFAAHWEEIARLILPTSRNTFYFQSFNWPGQKKTDEQIDATGMLALQRFTAICDSLLTPRNMTWHGLEASNRDVNKIRKVKLWFEEATRALFKARYAATANFPGQNHANYTQLGAFGTHGMFIDDFMDQYGRPNGLRYKSIPLGELFLKENHQGLIDGFIRWFKLDALQAYTMFGPERFPLYLYGPLKQGSKMLYNFLHRVCPRRDYDPTRYDHKAMSWRSDYVCVDGLALMRESGYYTFPMAIGRYVQTPNEVYGRSPAMMVLPALKTLNLEKKVFLKQGHRAADPILLTADDGLIDGASLRPGAINKGGVSSDGKPLIHVLPSGEIQISKEMMLEERNLINDAFLVTLFQILTESPQMTATEVIERTNEKGILLAPTVGRQQSEYLGPMIDRELDLLQRQRKLSPMPQELIEAQGEYEVVYTSPLAKAMRAQEAAGFQRTVENVREMVAITGDTSMLDPFDFDTAVPEIADIQGVPASWMASPQQIAEKRKNRAAAQKRQEQIQAAPAMAAQAKVQLEAAKVAKLGAGPNSTGGGALQAQPQGTPQFQP